MPTESHYTSEVPISRLFRTFVSGALLTSVLALSPLSASASAATEYVVVNRDGSIDVRTLTSAQADSVAADSNVRIVQPNNKVTVDESGADIVTGLNVSSNAVAGDIIPGRYIVSFTSNTASQVAASSLPVGILASYTNALTGFVADLTAKDIAALQANPNVVAIEPDSVVAVNVDQTNATWGLDRIDQRALPTNSTYSYTATGKGVTAYIVDTGIYAEHSEYAGRVQSGFTAVSDGNGTNDCHGHGTHVSGTVAGKTYGVAKEATLVPVRVLGCAGSGSMSGVIAGIDWAIANHATGVPAVANMSLGGGFYSTLNTAIDRATADGITMVVAAGNSNADACLSSPSSAASAITVAASTSTDARASFSNWGTCVDVYAPGQSITSSMTGGTTNTATWSGTSMASPHVAGIAALYLQNNTSATPATVTAALLAAATQGVVTDAGTGTPNRLAYSLSFTPSAKTVPSAPSALVATSATNAVSLTWNAPAADGGAAVTDYKIEYSTNNSSTWITFADGVSTTRAATVTGLTSGTTYLFRVSATNSVGTGSASATATAAPVLNGVASAPRNLTGTSARLSVSLSWLAPLTNGGTAVTDYIIESSSNAGTSWAVVPDTVSAATSLTVSNLTANLEYTFRVKAVNASGVSAASNTMVLTPTGYNPPSVVRSVAATARLAGATVTWVAPLDNGGSAVLSYVVDYSTDKGVTYSAGTRVAATVTSATLSNLAGVPHIIRVRATNAYGTSADATTAVTPIAYTVPDAPTNLVVNVGYNSASLYWTGPTYLGGTAITGYVAEYSINNGVSWVQSNSIASTARTLAWSGLAGGTSHQFRVKAVNAIGTGAASSAVTAIPVAITAPSSPQAFSGYISGTSAFLSWGAALSTGGSDITGYTVWVSTNAGATWTAVTTTAPTIRTATITNLVNGTSYMFRATANNAIGASAPSNSIALAPKVSGAPNPPSTVSATVNTTKVVVTWAAVVATAAPVTDYIVEYSLANSTTWSVWPDGVSTATTATITGLTPDIAVSVRIKAVNSFGPSPASAIVTVTPRSSVTAPLAPTGAQAASGDTRAAVRWLTPANNGGSIITSYTVTSSPGGFTCTTATNACVVTGLTNGVAYTFTVTATNAVGTSPASLPTNEIIPVTGGIAPVTAASWGLDRTDQRALPLDSLIARGGTGAGVTAYVIDTGVYTSHTQFTGRIGAGFSAVADTNGTNDCNGHGSHVAGTIAGSTYGFATMATIIPVRVLDCTGAGTTSGVVSGINWVINHHVAGVPAVANMSLGGGYDVALNDAVARAVADGITFVVAAGNSSTDACTASPASTPAAITVGATTSSDSIASYSNFGACVDILAPGSSIISAGISSSTASATMSGTSMASPHVAGVAAVILGNNRALTPAQVAGVLGADATRGVVTGVGTSTVNALLYETPATTNSFNFFDDANTNNSSYDNGSDYSSIDYGNDPGVLPDPAVSKPATPKTDDSSNSGGKSGAPVHKPAKKTGVAVKSVARVGKNYRVTVAAPTGALITLYRNGKKVAMSKSTRFLVPVGKISSSSFHAMITVSGARVVSASVSYVVHTASRK